MKLSTIQSLVSYLNGETLTNLDEIKAELEAELNKNAEAKAKKSAEYETAWDSVREVLSQAASPLTVAEISEQARKNNALYLFSKGQIQYGLNHNWADRIVKIEGRPNTYRLA